MDEVETPWFQHGLKFKCTGCGKCCTGSPGYVFLSNTDLVHLAEHAKITPREFAEKYTRLVEGELALTDQPNGDCTFLKDKRCTVYEARPVQCRTFPWWIENLRSIQDWNEAALSCEGINHPDAPLIPSLHIQEQCLTYLDNLLEQNFDL